MDYESPQPKVDMVASLQSRKDSLEAKIKEKNEELKALCIQEAELTGVLPLETPLEAGESPPVFRRRVGTAFTYPENLINKLKSKEEESLATLELEYNIQTGIAEAARSLANDGTVSKAARRKHRLAYQQSQRRLLELESRLNLLRQASRCPLKQRKKPRPPLESDQVDGGLIGDNVNGVSLSPVQDKGYHQSHPVVSQGGSARYGSVREPAPGMPYRNSHRQIQSELGFQSGWGYQPSSQTRDIERPHRVPHDHQGNRYKDSGNWYNTAPTSRYLGVGSKPDDEEREKTVRYRDRFGSLDRRRGSGETIDSELRQSVLLPNQTYPETNHHLTQTRKTKEKDWFETSLDTSHPSPTPPPPPHTPTPTLPHFHPPHPHPHPHHSPSHTPSQHHHTHTRAHSHTSGSEGDPSEQIHMPVTQQLSFDTVVPFESPKNHTVVQAGMWQPYREVTKPFEMADFYKYSTKFRKNSTGAPPVSQQKAIYRPLQPMTCEPLALQESGGEVPKAGSSTEDPYSHEMLSWYQDQNTPQPRSATLV